MSPMDQTGRTWEIHPHASPAEQRKAALYVVLRGRTLEERRELLAALGLLPKAPAGNRSKKASVPATTTADAPINTTTGDPA